MELGEFLNKLCRMFQETFFASYGDSKDSTFGVISLPASSEWLQISSISNPCILYFRNLSAVNEVMITWNKDNSIGMIIEASTSILLDGVSGVIFAKVYDPATTANINIGVISKRITDL